jgi:hypothetical protein
MKAIKLILFIIHLSVGFSLFAQQNVIIPDLTQVNNADIWVLHNRSVTAGNEIHLDGKPEDGLLWIKNSIFSNGKIEVDIKGKDEAGRSFVGVAFHGINATRFDAVYFRPFNFKSAERNGHSVQYISHPTNTWFKLREDAPGKYENPVSPVPDPNDWFHATIIINYPFVNVYLNNSSAPSLTVEQLSSQKQGWIGFWVGNNSEGWFKNLRIIPD